MCEKNPYVDKSKISKLDIFIKVVFFFFFELKVVYKLD